MAVGYPWTAWMMLVAPPGPRDALTDLVTGIAMLGAITSSWAPLFSR